MRTQKLEQRADAIREQRDFLATVVPERAKADVNYDFTTDESYVKRESVINALTLWLSADTKLDAQEREFDHKAQTRENRSSNSQEDEKVVATRNLRDYILTGDRNMILQQRANMASNGTTTGGYMVPTFVSAQVVKDLEALESVRKAGAEIMPVEGNENVPVWADADANFIVEAASVTATDPTVANCTIRPQLLICKTTFSLQLANRAANFGDNLSKSFVRGIAKKEASSFLTGTGTNEPEGLVIGGSQGGATTASATTFTIAELSDLWYALRPEYQANATWILSAGAASIARSLQTSNGAFAWVPNLRDGSDQLFGRPVIIDPYMDAVTASKRPVVVADMFSAYVIGEETGLTVLSDPYTAMGTGEAKLYVYKFVDGRVKKAAAAKYLLTHA